MIILFDQGTLVPLRRHLAGHTVDTAFEMGWSKLLNGELLDRTEEHGYELIITTDQQIRNQQNLVRRQIAVLVLLSTSWPRIQLRIDDIREAVNEMQPGDYREVPI